MHILILGGSADHPGGVEAFCERSRTALLRRHAWRIEWLPTDSAYLKVSRLPKFASNLMALVRYRRLKPDCIWLSYVTLPDLAYLVVAKALGLKVMVTPHLGSNWRSQENPVLRAISGWALSLADRLALISKTQELEIRLPPETPRSLIRNFLPETLLESDIPPEGGPPELQLIHSGRLMAGKGTFMVVEVCKILRDAGTPFLCRITGGADAETYAKLNGMIAEYGLQDKVLVLGRVSEEDLLTYLRGSDVLIHLSRIDSYPLILLEAMSCSMFPVAMELAGARDMIETFDGLVVSQDHPVEETANFLMTCSLDDLRRRGRSAASQVRAEYAWDNAARAAQTALETTVSGNR
jgi:glycosyltransferase involved in cell wall biosynthesis